MKTMKLSISKKIEPVVPAFKLNLSWSLKILSSLTNRAVERVYLALKISGELFVGQIVEMTGMPQSQVSWSLSKLREARLVNTEKQGAFVTYSINEEREKEIYDAVQELIG